MIVSEEDIERLRAAYEAWNRGEREPLMENLDPAFELHDLDVPDSPVFRGRDGFRTNLERLAEIASEFRLEPRELTPVGDRILAIVHVVLRGRGSGVEVEQDVAHLWTLRDGKGLRLEIYLDVERGREAAGLAP